MWTVHFYHTIKYQESIISMSDRLRKYPHLVAESSCWRSETIFLHQKHNLSSNPYSTVSSSYYIASDIYSPKATAIGQRLPRKPTETNNLLLHICSNSLSGPTRGFYCLVPWTASWCGARWSSPIVLFMYGIPMKWIQYLSRLACIGGNHSLLPNQRLNYVNRDRLINAVPLNKP